MRAWVDYRFEDGYLAAGTYDIERTAEAFARVAADARAVLGPPTCGPDGVEACESDDGAVEPTRVWQGAEGRVEHRYGVRDGALRHTLTVCASAACEAR